MKSRVTYVIGRIRHGASVAIWCLRSAAETSRVRVLAALALPALGAIMQASALGVMLFVVKALADSTNVALPGGLELPISRETTVVAVWVISILLVYGIASTAVYAGEAIGYDVARFTARRFARQGILRLQGASTRPDPALMKEAGAQELRRSVIADAGPIVRATMTILRLMAPTVWFVISFTILIVMNAWLTGILVVVLGILAYPISWLTRDAVRAARDFEDTRRARSRGLAPRLDWLLWNRAPGMNVDEHLVDYDDLPMDHLRRILLARRRVNLAREIAAGTAMALVIIVFTATAPEGEGASWPALLAYLVFLRATMGQLGDAARMLTTFGRFLPPLERVRRFTTDGPDEPAAADDTPSNLAVRVREPKIAGTSDALTLEPGSLILLLTDHDLHAGALPRLARAMLGARNSTAVLPEIAVAGAPGTWHPGPDAIQIEATLAERIAAADANVDPARTIGALAPALEGEARLVVCRLADLQLLNRIENPDAAAPILERLESSPSTVIAHAVGLPDVLPQGVGGAIALYDGRVIGAGDAEWLASLDASNLPDVNADARDARDDDRDDDDDFEE